MFNFFKNLGLAFKNKTATAEALWKIIGPPIVLARKWSKVREKSYSTSYSGFTMEFMKDEYLTGYFGGYINFMLINFFKITKRDNSIQFVISIPHISKPRVTGSYPVGRANKSNVFINFT